MGQKEVYELLKSDPQRDYDYKDIAEIMDITAKNACACLLKLARFFDEIERLPNARYKYKEDLEE